MGAFTLMESLVVMAILVVLVSLAIPELHRARKRIQAIECANNLRQWGVATHLYALDNGDLLPAEGSSNGRSARFAWYVLLPRVMGLPTYHAMPWRTNAAAELSRSIWLCGSNTNRSNGNNLFHYCLNEHVDGTGAEDRPTRLGTIAMPEKVVWMFDNGGRAAVAQQNNVHTNVHRQGAHIGFLDGHVSRFANREYWDFVRQRGRTDNPDVVWVPR